jgi:hypothetical protein
MRNVMLPGNAAAHGIERLRIEEMLRQSRKAEVIGQISGGIA